MDVNIGDIRERGGVVLVESLPGSHVLVDVDDADLTEEAAHHGVGEHGVTDPADPDDPELVWLDGHGYLLKSSRSAIRTNAPIINPGGFNLVTAWLVAVTTVVPVWCSSGVRTQWPRCPEWP